MAAMIFKVPPHWKHFSVQPVSVQRLQWEHLQKVLHDCRGNIVVLRQPLINRRRQQIGCVTIALTEVAHARSLIEVVADPIRSNMKSSALSPTGC